MSQIQAKTSVLEDGDAALLAGGQAQVLGEGEEFVDLNSPTVDDDEPAQPAAKKDDKAAAPAAAAATAPAAGADDDLPPEYRGKTAKEIAKMHQEAQQALGRQGTELGELRKYADLFVRDMQQRRAATATKPGAQKPQPIEESQVFAKPIESISALIEQHPVVQQLRRDLGAAAAAEAQRRMVESKQRFDSTHPDAGEILQDPEFRKWVGASPKRRQMLLDANNKYDFESGDEVFSTWKALNKKPPLPAPAAAAAAATDGAPSEAEVSAAAATLARARAAKQSATQAAAQAAAAPTGGASAAAGKGGGKKLYRRSEVINLMINDPDKYEAMSGEIQKAYAEGRVR